MSRISTITAAIFLPFGLHAQPPAETGHSVSVTPEKPGVCVLRSAFDGEIHRIDLNFSADEGADYELDLQNNMEVTIADGALWAAVADTTTSTTATVRATTYAKK